MPVKKMKIESRQALLFELPMRGKQLPVIDGASFFPVYKNKGNILYEGDSLEWLKSIESESVDLVFADPPYNIKKADWDKFESQEKYISWSMKWIVEAARVLKKAGTLYISDIWKIGFRHFSKNA